MVQAGRVAALFRYPVKSLLGEPVDSVAVDDRGVVGDRLWAVYGPDGKLGSGKSTRRFRRMEGLFDLAARYAEAAAAVPVLELPDGTELAADDAAVHERLSSHLGQPVTLCREGAVPHLDDGPVHLVTTASLAALGPVGGSPVDVRRLRPNLLLDTGPASGFVEDDWIGSTLAVGPDVVLRVVAPMPRCVMVDLAQRDLPDGDGVLRAAHERNDGDVGVLAEVVRLGRLSVGDVVTVSAGR